MLAISEHLEFAGAVTSKLYEGVVEFLLVDIEYDFSLKNIGLWIHLVAIMYRVTVGTLFSVVLSIISVHCFASAVSKN